MPSTVSTNSTSSGVALNKQYIRGAVLIAVLAASGVLSKRATTLISSTHPSDLRTKYHHELLLIHLFAFASWFGCSIWVSFIAGIVMFKNLPRHTFGRLQSKLFPAYFIFSALCIGISLASVYILQWDDDGGDGTGWTPLLIILATILLNLFYLEPQTTSIMFQRHVVERKLGTGQEIGLLQSKDPSIANNVELKQLSKRFGMYHGMSTTLNLIALGFGCYWMNTIIVRLPTLSSSG
jgi:hypothetical protein